MNDDRRDENEEKPRIIIEDKRFSRDEEDDEEETARKDEPDAPPDSDTGDVEIDEAATGDAKSDSSPSQVKQGESTPTESRKKFEVIEEPAVPPAADPTMDDFDRDKIPTDDDAFRELTKEDEERLRNAAKEQLSALSKIGIENYLRDVFNVAYILSLQYLGLQPNPNTNLTARDLKRAAICIDVIDFMKNRLDDFLSPEEKTHIGSLLAALKMEYSKVVPPPPGKE
ncbi:DUF1844 domain-containing protein [bacterium]|nr:DUF1844 domain-containing protein [bacterium]